MNMAVLYQHHAAPSWALKYDPYSPLSSFCTNQGTLLDPLEEAGFRCFKVDILDELMFIGDSNDDFTEEKCAAMGGTWEMYSCLSAQESYQFAAATSSADLGMMASWWKSQCCKNKYLLREMTPQLENIQQSPPQPSPPPQPCMRISTKTPKKAAGKTGPLAKNKADTFKKSKKAPPKQKVDTFRTKRPKSCSPTQAPTKKGKKASKVDTFKTKRTTSSPTQAPTKKGKKPKIASKVDTFRTKRTTSSPTQAPSKKSRKAPPKEKVDTFRTKRPTSSPTQAHTAGHVDTFRTKRPNSSPAQAPRSRTYDRTDTDVITTKNGPLPRTEVGFVDYYYFFTEPIIFFLANGIFTGGVAWLNQRVFLPHMIPKLASILSFVLLSWIYLLLTYTLRWSQCIQYDCAPEELKPLNVFYPIITQFCFHLIIIGIISVILAFLSSRKKMIENEAISCIAVLLASGTIALYSAVKQGYAKDSSYFTEALGSEKPRWVLDILFSSPNSEDAFAYDAAHIASSWFIVKVLYHCRTAEVASSEDVEEDVRAANIYQDLNVHIYKPLGVLAAQMFLGLLFGYALLGHNETETFEPAFYCCSTIVLLAYVIKKNDPITSMKTSAAFWGSVYKHSKAQSTSTLLKLSFFIRFYADVYVNAQYFIFILVILPYHNSQEDTSTLDFVLNCVAIFYIVELDDYTASISVTFMERIKEEEHGPLLGKEDRIDRIDEENPSCSGTSFDVTCDDRSIEAAEIDMHLSRGGEEERYF